MSKNIEREYDKKKMEQLPPELTHALLFAMDMTGHYYPFKAANDFDFYSHFAPEPPKFITSKYDRYSIMNLAIPMPRWPKMFDMILAAEGWNSIYSIAMKAYQCIYDETTNFFKPQSRGTLLDTRYTAFSLLNEAVILLHIRNILCIHYYRCLPKQPAFFDIENLKIFIKETIDGDPSGSSRKMENKKILENIREQLIFNIKTIGKNLVSFYSENHSHAPLHEREVRFLSWFADSLPFFITLNFMRVETTCDLFEAWTDILFSTNPSISSDFKTRTANFAKRLYSSVNDAVKFNVKIKIAEKTIKKIYEKLTDIEIDNISVMLFSDISDHENRNEMTEKIKQFILNVKNGQASEEPIEFTVSSKNRIEASLEIAVNMSLLFIDAFFMKKIREREQSNSSKGCGMPHFRTSAE